MRTALRGSLGAIFCLGASLGCLSAQGSRYAYFIAPDMEGSPAAKRWLIAPVSAIAPVPDFLVDPGERIGEELHVHIEAAGRRVQPLSQSQVLELTGSLPTLQAAGSEGISDETLSALTRMLAETREFDVFAYPELVIHPVQVPQGRTGVWNGVRRKTRVLRGPEAPEGLFSMSGFQPGVSLRMRIFGPDGSKHFESYGGLDFLQEARVVGRKFQMVIRADLLSDHAVLREGIQLALMPYVPEIAPQRGD